MAGIAVGDRVLTPGCSMVVTEEERMALLPFIRAGRLELVRQKRTGRWVAHYPTLERPEPQPALTNGHTKEVGAHVWERAVLEAFSTPELRKIARDLGVHPGHSKTEAIEAIIGAGGE